VLDDVPRSKKGGNKKRKKKKRLRSRNEYIDDGLEKGYFIKLAPRAKKTTDSKIRNIRPSEDLVVEFINWNIDLIATAATFQKKYE
jgi:hypothetical protein